MRDHNNIPKRECEGNFNIPNYLLNWVSVHIRYWQECSMCIMYRLLSAPSQSNSYSDSYENHTRIDSNKPRTGRRRIASSAPVLSSPRWAQSSDTNKQGESIHTVGKTRRDNHVEREKHYATICVYSSSTLSCCCLLLYGIICHIIPASVKWGAGWMREWAKNAFMEIVNRQRDDREKWGICTQQWHDRRGLAECAATGDNNFVSRLNFA